MWSRIKEFLLISEILVGLHFRVFFSYWVFHLSLLGLTSLFTNPLGDLYLCYVLTQVGIYGSWVSPFSGTWNHKRSWVQTIIGFLDTSFCDIRQIKISEQIYLSKPDIIKKKKNHLIIQVKYHTSKFFFCDVNLPDMYCYLIVRYQHLGFHIYFVRKMPWRLLF
jgi:hypothetical protein